MATFLPTVWHETKAIPIAFGTRFVALAFACNGAGILVASWLISRGYPTARMLCASFILPAALMGLAFVTDLPFWWQCTLALSCMFILGIVPGVIFATAPMYAQSPRQISLLIGLVFQGAATGQVLGPILFSKMIELAGGNWNYALGFFIGFALLGGLFMWRIDDNQPSKFQSL